MVKSKWVTFFPLGNKCISSRHSEAYLVFTSNKFAVVYKRLSQVHMFRPLYTELEKLTIHVSLNTSISGAYWKSQNTMFVILLILLFFSSVSNLLYCPIANVY